jgi:hypothetical protein
VGDGWQTAMVRGNVRKLKWVRVLAALAILVAGVAIATAVQSAVMAGRVSVLPSVVAS